MSNYYKNPQVKDGMYTRVIDNNSLLEEKLARIAHEMEKKRMAKLKAERAEAGDISDGESEFSEGIINTSLDVDPEMELNYVEHAKEEAERITVNAAAEAEQILERAKQEAESMKERILQEASDKGYAEGRQRAEEEAAVLRQQIEQQRLEQERQYQERLTEMESELMQVICTVFERVFQIELEGRQDVLLTLIQNAVQKVKDSREFRLCVSEADYSFVQEKKQEIQQKIGAGLALEVLSDVTYTPGQCTIDTDSGIFDCSIDTELNGLMKELRILSCMNESDKI